MENFTAILHNMVKRLDELDSTLAEENRQLSQAQINPVSLQVISDNKSRLLAAINFYDEQRRQEETQLRIAPPFVRHREPAALWERITRIVKKCNEQNQQSFQLLEMHMKRVSDVKKLVSQVASSPMYGASGGSGQQDSGTMYRISV